MKKIFIITIASLSLVGCGTLPQEVRDDISAVKSAVSSVVNPDNFDTLQATYGTALSGAVAYRNLCQRKVINKSCWVIIAKMQPYEDRAYNSLITLRDFVRANPNAAVPLTLIQTAKIAITAFKNFTNANGVN